MFLAWEMAAERGSAELAIRLESVTELITSIRRALADLAPDVSARRPYVEALAEAMNDLLRAIGHADACSPPPA